MKVAILGASPKEERYSFKALQMLKEYKHEVFPVNPANEFIDGSRVYKTLADIDDSIEVLTVYVGSDRMLQFKDEILRLKPRIVIFNPGTENQELATILRTNEIEVLEACTLVLLRTGQFATL